MSRTYPGTVKIHVIGQTHEGRDIKVARIGNRWEFYSLVKHHVIPGATAARVKINIPRLVKIMDKLIFFGLMQ